MKGKSLIVRVVTRVRRARILFSDRIKQFSSDRNYKQCALKADKSNLLERMLNEIVKPCYAMLLIPHSTRLM